MSLCFLKPNKGRIKRETKNQFSFGSDSIQAALINTGASAYRKVSCHVCKQNESCDS